MSTWFIFLVKHKETDQGPKLAEQWRTLKKILIFIMAGLLGAGCYAPRVNKYETAAYQLASPENKLRIEHGEISAGMSIEECKASRPEYYFTNKFTSINGAYELWEVKRGQGKDLYLQVVNGKIEKVSESEMKDRTKPIKLR